MDFPGHIYSEDRRPCKQNGIDCPDFFGCFVLLFNFVLEAQSLQCFLCHTYDLFRSISSYGKFPDLGTLSTLRDAP